MAAADALDEPLTEKNLSKLTIPQLKTLCKDRKITGYSKLSKTGIIQKLLGAYSNSSIPKSSAAIDSRIKTVMSTIDASDASIDALKDPNTPLADVTQRAAEGDPTTLGVPSKIDDKTASGTCTTSVQNTHNDLDAPIVPSDATADNDITTMNATSVVVTISSIELANGNSVISVHAPFCPSNNIPPSTTNSLKKRHAEDRADKPSKKKKVTPESKTTVKETPDPQFSLACTANLSKTSESQATGAVVNTPPPLQSSSIANVRSKDILNDLSNQRNAPSPSEIVKNPKASPQLHTKFPNANLRPAAVLQRSPTDQEKDISVKSTTKKFTPLVTKKPAPGTPLQGRPKRNDESAKLFPLHAYLDFSFNSDTAAASVGEFCSISLPPSIAQRKHVNRFALALRDVAEVDLQSCALTSKMIRYAVYLSAKYRLLRRFPGRRLSQVLQSCSQHSTNLWPYLKERQREYKNRKKAYEESFLGQLASLKGRIPFSDALWRSPDHEEQINVAVRFLLTRLFFLVSIGDRRAGENWIRGMLVNAQEIVKNEIWCLTIKNGTSMQSCYVLKSTCEAVGHPPVQSILNADIDEKTAEREIELRSDWSEYIRRRVDPNSQGCFPTLMEHLTWPNHEEYDKGISRHFLKRIRKEDSLTSSLKKTVVERYVLACVVGNGVSGRWMSTTSMAQEFAGLSELTSVSKPKNPNAQVNLFLPKHHLIESVHFTTSKGQPLHPALAIIQTPDREYFVLRDNGMQVGCEEEGVAIEWMKLIGCKNSGEICAN